MQLKRRSRVAMSLGYILLTTVIFFVSKYAPRMAPARFDIETEELSEGSSPRRHLMSLEVENCTRRSIEEFPDDFLTLKQKREGGIIAHVLIALYLFAALAMVCDDYFVSSLEKICDVMKLKPDVAGATFMAAGSSAPELFTSVIGVFIAQSDVGISTIVGSAVFNILCIVALCGIFGGAIVYLTWWPMMRDTLYYCISILALIVCIHDSTVYWYEALIFLLLYVIYIVIMYFNTALEDFVTRHLPFRTGTQSEHSLLVPSETGSATGSGYLGTTDTESGVMEIKDAEEDDAFVSPLSIPESFIKRIYWIFMLPTTLVVFITVPDCRRPGCWQKLFFVTFVMSIVWIAGMSYILVWMVCAIGDTMGIPDTVMGLTILAAGTSVPDAMSSIFVARDGLGDMAVSNSIGSNIFDILVCLGLPWLLHTSISHEPVIINSGGLVFSVITLLSTVVFLLVAFVVNKWRLTRNLGFVFLFIYLIVIIFACMYELNLFDPNANLPPCPRIRV